MRVTSNFLLLSLCYLVGSIIVTTSNNASVVYASTAGEEYSFVKKWGTEGDVDNQFEEPTGIGIDASNNVYVSDTDFENCCNLVHHRVIKFTDDGAFITKWGGNLQFENPMGIAFDSEGNVYVVDQGHQLVKKFTNDGSTLITSWTSGFNPMDIAIDSFDNVYVTEMYDSRVAKFTSDGILIQRWNTGPISRGVAVDSSDNVYVTSANIGDTNYLVQKFTSDGVLLDQWFSTGNDGVNIPTYNGYGIAFDSFGKMFIADTFNNRIQKYNPDDGTLITQWGTPGSGDGEFDRPHDIAIDFSDNVYASDTFNHRIQVFALQQENPLPPPPDSSCIGSGSGKKIITGTDGPDILIGTFDNNLIRGLGEDDRIHGCGNNDVISGGTGNDGIAGGSGKDYLSGREGNDMLVGGPSSDIMNGGSGNDIFLCGEGIDTIADFNSGADVKSRNCEVF
jgi:Ca2+-binding RTX toxin-like protein